MVIDAGDFAAPQRYAPQSSSAAGVIDERWSEPGVLQPDDPGSVHDFGTLRLIYRWGYRACDRLECRRQRLVDLLAAIRLTHGAANLAQGAVPGSIEALTFAVPTEAHVRCVLPALMVFTQSSPPIHLVSFPPARVTRPDRLTARSEIVAPIVHKRSRLHCAGLAAV